MIRAVHADVAGYRIVGVLPPEQVDQGAEDIREPIARAGQVPR
ncbi:hypothetical protein ACIGW7_18960 [Streptomyces sp. NPDC053253]